ncbi:UDP-3-O-acyl-N-acetylglucosamine deacetylase [Rubinisphaera sp. JC750]|uniref:UDP-3-O-acyl-N-acetylglucosamine deacetylase n=1 Tax=Rubinisphaera sp. JC750 TaxID=2898658 RepID=UPI001F17CF92|nr:UDP-3-O-acyl-N-acetylglucosamine deacetylase [Rubinisphaera sp. JC750]
MGRRLQRTIQGVTELSGFGLFTNSEVRLRFFPAPEHHGIVFERTDLPGCPQVPATVAYLAPEERRTKLVCGEATVEMTEHLLAAFAGLQIDNCLVQIDAPELPGCDGSALPYAEALLRADPIEQSAERDLFCLDRSLLLDDEAAVLNGLPCEAGYRISYELNYGANSPIPVQMADFTITPEIFITKIAPARTFVQEQEIAFLRSRGYGKHVTFQDLVVYGADGPIENTLRAQNECARHKLLDCLGDLALTGCDLQGHIRAFRSGHRHNHDLARQIDAIRAGQSGVQSTEAASSRAA